MIELSSLKEWLGGPSGVDQILTELEARAVDLVEHEAERHFGASETFTEILAGTGQRTLWLNEAPTAITSVEYRFYPGDSWTEIASGNDDGFELRAPSSGAGVARLIRKGGYLWARDYEYRVIYDFGYEPGSEPPEIRQAVLDLVTMKYNERTTSGMQSETIGDYSYNVAQTEAGGAAIPDFVTRAVSRWRRSTRTLA